jgi:hypothetical protein
MRAMVVEVGPEIEQLVFEICGRPEQHAIQILASKGADEPFHEGMGPWNVGDGLDFLSPPVSADWLAIGGTYKADHGRN